VLAVRADCTGKNNHGRHCPLTSSKLSRSPLSRPLLIAVRMAVAPIPVVSLRSVVLPVVLTIPPVLCRQVTPVGAVFAVVPLVVITMVPIIDSDLDAAFLRSGVGHNSGWRSNSGSQE
jgi:uncharacterized YccA/Bax inhibitor family protein